MNKETFKLVARMADEMNSIVHEKLRTLKMLNLSNRVRVTAIVGKASLALTNEGAFLFYEEVKWDELRLDCQIEAYKALPELEKALDTQISGLYDSLSALMKSSAKGTSS